MFEAARHFLAGLLNPKQADEFADAVFSRMTQRGAPSRNTRELLAAYKESPWLRAVVSKIAYSFSAVPWKLFVRVDGDKLVRATTIQNACDPSIRRRLIKQADARGELHEITDHPLLDLLNEANPAMTGLNARRLTQTYLDLKGEAFWILERTDLGGVSEYWPAPPHWITEIPSGEKPFYKVTVDSRTVSIPAEDMIWFKDLNPERPYERGTGIGETLGDEIEADEFAAKHIKTWFLNRAVPETFLSVKGLSEAEARRAKETFERQHRGPGRGHRSHWTGGDVKITQLQQSFSDMELSDLRSWERDIVVNVFGVPPEILGILTSSNRATITASQSIYANEVLVPRLEFMRAELQAKLGPMFDDRLIIDYESPDVEDVDLRLDTMKGASWAFTRGEWRQFAGFEDRGEDDAVHMVPINLIPEDAPEEPEPPEPVDLLPEIEEPKRLTVGKVLDATQIELIAEVIDPDVIRFQAQPVWRTEMQKWGDDALAGLGVDVNFNLINPRVVDHLEQFSSTEIKRINDNTRNAVRQSLAAGVEELEGIPEMAQRIETVMADASRRRSVTIARTEVNRSTNFANVESFRQSGVVERKQWIETPDDRVRDTHAPGSTLAGQIVGLDEKFVSDSGAEADYPGDFGVAEEDINCRCGTVAVIAGRSLDLAARQTTWRILEREKIPWEKAARAAFQRAFREQEEAALARLREVAA